MNGYCSATTRTGKKCRAHAVEGGLCSLHADPSKAAELGRRSGKARRYVRADADITIGNVPSTARDVRQLLGEVLAEVRARKLDPKVASGLAYVSGAFLKAVEIADIECRIEQLEKKRQSDPLDSAPSKT